MTPPLSTVALVLALIVMLVGVIGTVVPVIPGTVLIFLAALVYAVLDGLQTVGWPSLIVLGLLTVVATTADIWATSVGARLGGASGWSVVAGLAGGLLGFVLLSLPGAIIGAIAGVLGSEVVSVRDWRQALKAGGGWLVGWILSTVVQLGAALTMVVLFVYQVWRGV